MCSRNRAGPVPDEDLGQRLAEHVVAPVAGELLGRRVEFHRRPLASMASIAISAPVISASGQRLPFGQRGHVVGVPDLRGHDGGDRVRGSADLSSSPGVQSAPSPIRASAHRHWPPTGTEWASSALAGSPPSSPAASRRRCPAGPASARRSWPAAPGRPPRAGASPAPWAPVLQVAVPRPAERPLGRLEGHRGPQAERGRQPGQHGGQRAERRVVRSSSATAKSSAPPPTRPGARGSSPDPGRPGPRCPHEPLPAPGSFTHAASARPRGLRRLTMPHPT